MKKIDTALIFVLLASCILRFLNLIVSYPLTDILESIITLFLVFILPGACIAYIIHAKKENGLSGWEYITISSASSLLILPLLLLGENIILGQLPAWIPLANAIGLFIVVRYIGKGAKMPSVKYIIQPNWTLAVSLLGFFILGIAAAYQAMPELDPYYWFKQYRDVVPHGSFFGQDRPFFYALTFLFVDSSSIDLYFYFKYIIPFLSILAVFPAILLAQEYKSPVTRLIILLIPVFTPSTFLYSQIPFPQAISITVMYYFFFWVLYSQKKKNDMWYIAAFVAAALSYFYHQIGIVSCIVWLIVTLIHSHKKIIRYIQTNKLIALLSGLLILSYSNTILHVASFPFFWLKVLFRQGLDINLLFPAQYINVDGHVVGWGNLIGVMKYYLYYIGPVLLLGIIWALVLLAVSKKYRQLLKKEIVANKATQVIISMAILLLIITEIFPRTIIALLPERLWTIGSIFSSWIIIQLAIFYKKNRLLSSILLGSTVLCSLIGIIYINNLKKYVIPAYQLESAAWIKDNLPEDRIMIVNGYENLLNVHAQSKTISIKKELYCDSSVKNPRILLSDAPEREGNLIPREDVTEEIGENVTSYLENRTHISMEDFISSIRPAIELLNENPIHQIAPEQLKKKNLYIYYTKDDSKNPYINRPYINKQSLCEHISFSQFPEHYEEIYNVNGQVIIWKVK